MDVTQIILWIMLVGTAVVIFAPVVAAVGIIAERVYIALRARSRGNRVVWLSGAIDGYYEVDRRTGERQPSDRWLRETYKRNRSLPGP